MDPTDFPNALDAAEHASASDPIFSIVAIAILMGALVLWVWNGES